MDHKNDPVVPEQPNDRAIDHLPHDPTLVDRLVTQRRAEHTNQHTQKEGNRAMIRTEFFKSRLGQDSPLELNTVPKSTSEGHPYHS